MDKGLDGLEAWYGAYTDEQRQMIARTAEALGLVVSGGSDFHGPERSRAKLGCPEIAYGVLETLKEKRASLK
jgi:predicted metal-dependent phosphoesterase TrpH